MLKNTKQWLWRNTPNALTMARLGIMGYIAQYLSHESVSFEILWGMLALFVVGSGTDFLDGLLARRYDLVTRFGGILDPIADKFLVIVYMVFLGLHAPSFGVYELVCGTIIIVREVYVDGLRWLLRLRGKEMLPSALGKWKLAAQTVALSAYGVPIEHIVIYIFDVVMLSVATLLTVLSALEYTFPDWVRDQAGRFPRLVRVFVRIDRGVRGLWA